MNQTSQEFIEKLSFNDKGLIPAIAQDWLDGAILMLAWMNKESLEKTLSTGEVHYWSRSREEIWHKGSTSGHFQILKDLRFDCDCDAIVLSIEQVGSIACHKGARSCFFQDSQNNMFDEKSNYQNPITDVCSNISEIIKGRALKPQSDSYTSSLFKEGSNKILKKIGEEGAEFVMACKDQEPEEIANEAADLIFHLQVALNFHKVEWKNVLEVLANRRDSKIKR